ncbi:TetR/AcrR family transcriptional regulator [Plantactinospora endophytica]|uniref:TetR family transcriptional regulator n=1 Tax=Plantactinospora endophytica TaxID=673535 RepID=A0ABQ4DVU5_9ACTN|nr:TetR/AcrR family transcriptional regulator [Plantactinospora endophytica]GIG86571.1 TetR family transcriptional regulator [Plantactinospora endophytica]
MTAPTRRERLRTAAVSEIKDGARRLLVTGGPQAISLRAIARDMGMTAPAIYRYFPSLEALIVELAGDLLDELCEQLEAARDTAGDEPLDQLVTAARAFRCWSVRHPVEFGLVFGSVVPGIDAFPDNCANDEDPGARLGHVFLAPLVELWRRNPYPVPLAGQVDSRLTDSLAPLREKHPELPVEVACLMLSGWTMLYGLVSMEVYAQLRWAVTDPEALFEAELAAFLQQLHTSTGTTPGTAATPGTESGIGTEPGIGSTPATGTEAGIGSTPGVGGGQARTASGQPN